MLLSASLTAGVVGLACASVLRYQGRWIFGHPRTRRSAPSGPHSGHSTRAVSLRVQAGVQLQGWLTLPDAAPSRLALWLGGRNEDVGWAPALASWLGPDWALCCFQYRGCGRSGGRPGETACLADAQAILTWAAAACRLPAEGSLVLGRSLGGALAVQLAARQALGGLVLVSPPASLRRLLMRHPLLLPAVPLLRHPFDALTVARPLVIPGLMLLAEEDERVPHAESRRLARALHCPTMTIPGTNHRTLPRHAATLAEMGRFAAALPAAASMQRA